jgi:hypothetical protein
MSDLRRSWLDNAYIQVPNLIEEPGWQELVEEANELGAGAFEIDEGSDEMVAHRDGAVTTHQVCAVHPGGPALRRLAGSRQLIDVAREATGAARLVPARFGYKYYRPGSFVGVHRDAVRCTITFTFGLAPKMDYMNWMPALRDATASEVKDRLGSAGLFPEGGSQLSVEYKKIKGFDGYGVPHWRRPFAQDVGILGTVCYFDL